MVKKHKSAPWKSSIAVLLIILIIVATVVTVVKWFLGKDYTAPIAIFISIIAIWLSWQSNKKAEERNSIAVKSNKIAEERNKIAKNMPSIKKHTDDLIEFLKEWESKVPTVSRLTQLNTDRNLSVGPYQFENRIEEIEKNGLYDDFIQNHVPDPEFKQKWEDYKTKADIYYEKKHDFFLRLKEDVEKETGLPYSGSCREACISEWFLEEIYKSCVQKLKTEIVDDGREPIEVPPSDQDIYYHLRYDETRIASGTQNEIKKAKDVFKRFTQSFDYFNQVNGELKEIAEMKNQTDEMVDKIRADLKEFQRKPMYPELCKYNNV